MNDLVAGILAGVAATVVGSILVDLVRDRWGDRIRVHRIRRVADESVEALLELYGRTFSDNNDYDLDELRPCMNERFFPPRPVPVENITLVALFHREVVGFIMCHYYPARKKGIVSYLAAEHATASVQKRAGMQLVKALKRALLRRGCDLLFYEVELPQERRRSRAKGPRVGVTTILKQRVEITGLVARELRFQYRCPRVSLRATEDATKRFALFCVGIRGCLPGNLPKAELQDHLRFLYLDCYGDLYSPEDPAFAAHQEALQGCLAEYAESLPDSIPLA